MTRRRLGGAILACLLAATGFAWAGDGASAMSPRPAERAAAGEAPLPEYRPEVGASGGSLTWDSLRGILALGGVLLLVGVTARLVRRWPGLLPRQVRPEGLQLVGRLPLSAKESVCVVRAGGEVLVVGVAAGGITLLHRLGPAAVELPRPAAGAMARSDEGSLPSTRFREVVARLRDVQAAWGVGATEGRGKS